MEKFVISKNTNGEFKYEFLDQFEQLIFGKSGYKNKAMCLKVIESIKRNAQEDSKFYRKRTADNECYFNLKSSNGQILGISEIYQDKATREDIIQFVKTTSANASIEDYSKKVTQTAF
ncbi:YegP family protein [Flavobacterium sp. FBOR7N2.3]|uniref:YegP family protein n=1 Tax=Flavobacterium magnesitis TaxID=3138077 RepID=A0ABV4TJP4_9FLAO